LRCACPAIHLARPSCTPPYPGKSLFCETQHTLAAGFGQGETWKLPRTPFDSGWAFRVDTALYGLPAQLLEQLGTQAGFD
jgi:hypothetical protein